MMEPWSHRWMLDAALAVCAVAVALGLRPWRAVPQADLPWPWLVWWAVMPLLWGVDRWGAASVLVQPLSGAPLLMLMAGWPLAVLAMLPVAAIVALLGGLGWDESLHRLVWLGLVPSTLALLMGAGIRRWLPHHLFIYILGRGFFVPLLALFAAGTAAALSEGAPAGLELGELLVGRWLSAWGDAFLTGMWAAIFVAFKPQWLATYSDRLYLPR